MQFTELVQNIEAVKTRNKRRLVALCGSPASGKSTLAVALEQAIPDSCVVPMDGFHLDNRILEQRGLLGRKGSADTFDRSGLLHLVARLSTEDEIIFPVFDRSLDLAIAGAGMVTSKTKTVIIEGNYLLLDRPGWRDLSTFWDFSIYLSVPETILRTRLMTRWHDHGISQDSARRKVEGNDLPNASFVTNNLLRADIQLEKLT
ncbi:MAG: nucleoside triphosphate hydrolase [Aliishimia sp.]